MAGLVVGVATAASFVRWRPVRVEVRGASMAPTLQPGDWALAVAPKRVRAGDVVVLEHPERPGFEMVKRVIAVPGERGLGRDEYWLEGDHPNPERSTDSRSFGAVRRDAIKARVLLVYWPPERRCLV